MKWTIALAALALAVSTAYADTRNSDKDAAVMEHKASPSNPTKQDEERTEAHSQPDTPHPTRTSPRAKAKKGSASTGSSAPTEKARPDQDRAFKALDLDGDGSISKAEAAGNAALVNGFDRADRNRDGKLSRAEYEALSKKLAKAR